MQQPFCLHFPIEIIVGKRRFRKITPLFVVPDCAITYPPRPVMEMDTIILHPMVDIIG